MSGNSVVTGQVFFITNANMVYDEAKSKVVTINANDTNYTEYTFDFTGNTYWTGTLKQLRFDPVDTSGNVSIDYIALVDKTMDSYTASKDFSVDRSQGYRGWYYQYLSGSTYTDMDTWQATYGGEWVKNGTLCLIGNNWQHPEVLYDSVRKWVAPYSGTVSISGTATLQDPSYSNSVKVTIKKKSGATTTTLWGTYTLTISAPSQTHNLTNISVGAGDILYFILNANGDNVSDTTAWDPTITFN